MSFINNTPFYNVKLKDGFWKSRYDINKTVSIENVMNRFEETGRFDALRFNYLKTGIKPHIFYDSDVAKWIEAIGYLISCDKDGYKKYEDFIDQIVDCMESAQRDNGYINSYFQQIEPEGIFKGRLNHELYCAGHLIEAAIAYHKATGKRKLLDVMERMCECINQTFFVEKSAEFLTPGHEEIELALYKLYDYTGNIKYKEMSDKFLKARSNSIDHAHFNKKINEFYAQDDKDVYSLRDANGHCVRGIYLYNAMADKVRLDNDTDLKKSLDSIFDDIINRKMYITGGVGSDYRTESFSVPYYLPNDKAYTESCCAIALIHFATAMRKIEKSSKYGDLVERILYNSLLSSTSTDGKSFFYTNPLEIALEDRNVQIATSVATRDWLPITQRVEVFECSCCPPNITRMIASLGDVICFEEDCLTIEQYIASEINTPFGNIEICGEYHLGETMKIKSDSYTSDKISFRIPFWCSDCDIKLDGKAIDYSIVDGYVTLNVVKSFSIDINFNFNPVYLASNPNVRANAGRVALTYGPIVYCIEGVDNGDRLNTISVDVSKNATVNHEEKIAGAFVLNGYGYKESNNGILYYPASLGDKKEITLKFIPYYAFANRGETDMQVFIRKH